MAKIFNLYRLSLTTDDKATLDRIDFNDPNATDYKDYTKENAIITSVRRVSTHSVGDNQPATVAQGNKDELGNAEKMYIIEGKIKNTLGNSSNGQNTFLILLDLWDSESSQIANWPEGRFGIDDAHNNVNNVTPVRTGTSQIGLIWDSYDTIDDLGANETKFTIRLQTSKGDGT